MKRTTRFLALFIAIVLFSLVRNAAAQTTTTTVYPPMLKAKLAMLPGLFMSVKKVTVPEWGSGDNATENFYYAFQQRFQTPTCGFIFYPGAFVDPRSYAPMLRDIARAGYLVVVVKMPTNIALLGPDRAKEVIAQYPDIQKWVIGGHSLGGEGASLFIKNNIDKGYTDKMEGLVMWAAYGYSGWDLDNATVKTMVISASKDAFSTPAKIEAGKPYLPPDTQYLVIEGGNHTQFGWYNTRPSPVQILNGVPDNPADISRRAQQRQIVDATLELLESVSSGD